jgi:hypothetical protein
MQVGIVTDWEITGDHIPCGFGQHREEVERKIRSGLGPLEADTQGSPKR